jgi:carboxypeptidase C (cathepsin A)
MNRNGIDRDRVTTSYYPAGHMMYVHEPSLEAVTKDMRAFLTAH